MDSDISKFFPYDKIRSVQAEMINLIKRATDEGKHVAIEGSTGMGKTISAICGVLISKKSKKRRIVYCCRTHKQMDRVIEELREINRKQNISGISLRGRREMCINPVVRRSTTSASETAYTCGMMKKLGKCEFYENMCKHEERVAELEHLLSNRPTLAEELISMCEEERFCPYEIAKKVLPDMKVVAGSYVYMLDPSIRPLFLRYMHASLSDLIVILDEAHNLPDVATEIASASLSTFSIEAAIREAKEFDDEFVYRVTNEIYEIIERLEAKHLGGADQGEALLQGQEPLESIKSALKSLGFGSKLENFFDSLEKIGEEHMLQRVRQGKAPRSYLHKLGEFLSIWSKTSGQSQYMHAVTRTRGKRGQPLVRLEIQALDPRVITEPLIDEAHSVVSISGTLSPIEAYRDVIGLPKDTLSAQYPSPFNPENVLALAALGVTTKETSRTPEMYKKIVWRIAEIADATPANVGVFTASYEVLERLLDAGLSNLVKKPVFVEGREMSSSKNDLLINKFKSHAKKGGSVLVGVQGGRNSEGGDFPGDEMNAVVVVGIPYGRPSKRTEVLINYYESQFPGKGKLYGYFLPAHRRMCQAAGRAHRLLSDRAAVIFLDWRVVTTFVKRSLPSWVRERLEVLPDKQDKLTQRLQSFFQE